MSFSGDIKTELCRIRVKGSARLAQLAGLTKACGSLCLTRDGRSIAYKTESNAVAKLIAALAADYTVESKLERQSLSHRKNPLYIVTLAGADIGRLLTDTGVLPRFDEEVLVESQLPEHLTDDEEAKRALLRGAFLGSGSVSDPARGYHLEIVARSEDFGDCLVALLQGLSLDAKLSLRKGQAVVYLKSEDVSGFLACIGANAGAISFENTRTVKDYRNYMNRTSNCTTANIGKTVNASVNQRRAIALIDEQIGLEKLPPPLYEAALLRLQHPDASLQELAELAEIGKSGMNHRLARLLSLAKELEAT